MTRPWAGDDAGRHDEVLGATGRRALVAVAAVLVVAGPALAAVRPFLLFLLSRVLVFALFAVALDLVFGYAGLPSFGHAAMFGAGGYAAAFLVLGGTTELAVVLPATFLVGVAVAAVIGWLSVRSRGIYFAMLTLAFAQVLYVVAFNDFPAAVLGVERVTNGDSGLVGVGAYTLAGVDLGSRLPAYYLVLAVVAASVALILRLANSPFGRAIQGVRENEARMEAVGYDVDRYKVVAFAISGGFTGLAGGLYVPLQSVAHPQLLNWTLSGELIVMVLLGGMGTLWGPMVGAGLVVVLEDLLSSIQGWRLVLGTVFVVTVIFAPDGLAGALRTLRSDPGGAARNVRVALRNYARKVRR